MIVVSRKHGSTDDAIGKLQQRRNVSGDGGRPPCILIASPSHSVVVVAVAAILIRKLVARACHSYWDRRQQLPLLTRAKL